MDKETLKLIALEGWRVVRSGGKNQVEAFGKLFPVVHPFSIYCKLYREETIPLIKFNYFKRMSELLWPQEIFHEWTKDRYQRHCEDWKYISYAGGASCAKSRDAAKIALLFWVSDPKNNAAIIASTTVASLMSRIAGYAVNLLKETVLDLPYEYMRSPPPKILYDKDDMQHGIFCVAAKQGEDRDSIKDIIGRHPRKRLLIVLDEATDMPLALTGALPNLEQGVEWFQCMLIGNSDSKYDLHGAMSTPKNGWDSVSPMTHTWWETTQPKGICLYTSPYNSPAITDPDPKRRQALGKFLITAEQIKEKEKLYGKDSVAFWRFVLGFWQTTTSNTTIMSPGFVQQHNLHHRAEFAGYEPLQMVAGLDAAFSTGGDSCLLQLAALGQTTSGDIVIDFRDKELLHKIEISATTGIPIEMQIAAQVNHILNQYQIPLSHLAVDSNGQGRALSGTIYLQGGSLVYPIKIYATRGGQNVVNSIDVHIITTYDLWDTVRNFAEHNQIRGLNKIAAEQFCTRQVIIQKNGKPVLEVKGDYKKRMGAIMPSLARSPDEADVVALCLQAAIKAIGFTLGQRRALPQQSFDPKFEAFRRAKQDAMARVLGPGPNWEQQQQQRGTPNASFSATVESFVGYKPPFS